MTLCSVANGDEYDGKEVYCMVQCNRGVKEIVCIPTLESRSVPGQ